MSEKSEKRRGMRAASRSWEDELKTMQKLPMAFRLTRLPIIGKYLYRNLFVGDREARNWIIPVNQVIKRGKSVALPLEVLTLLFQKASFLKRTSTCICREAYGCQAYPHHLACIWMGDRTRKMPDHWGEEISYEEALDHAKRAIGEGLVPTIVYDSTMVNLLAMCFCCDCCCDIRLGLRLGPKDFWERVMPPPGVTAVVDDSCTLCGECTKEGVCVVKAISLGEVKAEINPSTSKSTRILMWWESFSLLWQNERI